MTRCFRLSLPTLLLLLFACSGDGGDDTASDDKPGEVSGCDACADSQICVVGFPSTGDNVYRCEPIPEVCGDVANCFDVECEMAMYDACPSDTWAWACSDTFPPTVISCNY
jgi:hypothetical protein